MFYSFSQQPCGVGCNHSESTDWGGGWGRLRTGISLKVNRRNSQLIQIPKPLAFQMPAPNSGPTPVSIVIFICSKKTLFHSPSTDCQTTR